MEGTRSVDGGLQGLGWLSETTFSHRSRPQRHITGVSEDTLIGLKAIVAEVQERKERDRTRSKQRSEVRNVGVEERSERDRIAFQAEKSAKAERIHEKSRVYEELAKGIGVEEWEERERDRGEDRVLVDFSRKAMDEQPHHRQNDPESILSSLVDIRRNDDLVSGDMRILAERGDWEKRMEMEEIEERERDRRRREALEMGQETRIAREKAQRSTEERTEIRKQRWQKLSEERETAMKWRNENS